MRVLKLEIFYPLNKQKIYKKFAKKKNYVTDNFYKKGILLPTYPSLNNSNIKYICDNLKNLLINNYKNASATFKSSL